MVTAVSASPETLNPTVFLSTLSELNGHIETYSNPKTSKNASAATADSAMLAVRKIINSCQSFNTAGDFLDFLHGCEKSLGINSNNSYVAISPFDENIRDTREYLVLLNRWLSYHQRDSLDTLSGKIDRTSRTDADARERMNNIKTLLSQCRYSASAVPFFSNNFPNNNEGLVHVRENFDSRYVLQQQWYHENISCGGTKKQLDNLTEVVDLSKELAQGFVDALDPDADGGIVKTIAGSNTLGAALPDDSLLQQTKKLQSYNPEFNGPFDVNQKIELGPIKISSSAIALFWQKIVRGSALLLNKGFGLFPNVNILDSIASIGRQGDEAYQNVKELQNKAVTSADALHKMMDTAGVIVAKLDKCDLEQHLAAARMVADAIENASIPHVTIDKNSFIDSVRNSFNQPGYKSYFVLHLMNSVRYEPLKNKCEQLLPHMLSNGLEGMRDLIMPLDPTTGDRKAPSIFAMLNVLKNSAIANLSDVSGKLGNFNSLFNSPDLKSQTELLSKTFFQNSALSPLHHIINKLGLTIEQAEHPLVTSSFGAKKVQSQFRDFWLQKVVPAVVVVCDPVVSLWNATKRVPIINFITGFPARVVEGVHGFAGSILGIVPFAGKHLKNTWELLTPAGLLHKNLEFRGTFHANNAAQFCLDSITTPFLDVRSQLEQISKNISSSANMHLVVSAAQNLRNITALLPAFITEQAKAERCRVHMVEGVFTRLGIPLEGQPPTTETFVKYFRKMIRDTYNNLYGEEGNATNAYTPPKITDMNPYGNRNASFGIQYVDSSGETITEFSDQYFDHQAGTMITGLPAKQRNQADFERLELDMKNANLELKAELSTMMKTGVLSYIDSISTFIGGIQQTTSRVAESTKKLVSPSSILGNFHVRPTPANVDKENGFFSKYTNIAKEVAGTMFNFRVPTAFPSTFADQQLCH
jgi:hypothetical protein